MIARTKIAKQICLLLASVLICIGFGYAPISIASKKVAEYQPTESGLLCEKFALRLEIIYDIEDDFKYSSFLQSGFPVKSFYSKLDIDERDHLDEYKPQYLMTYHFLDHADSMKVNHWKFLLSWIMLYIVLCLALRASMGLRSVANSIRRLLTKDGICKECGYQVSELPICPECGSNNVVGSKYSAESDLPVFVAESAKTN